MDDLTAIPPKESWGRLAAFVASLFYLVLLGWFAVIVILAMGWGLEPIIITSGSMSPAIRSGDLVLVTDAVDMAALGPGTVITFTDRARGDTLTSHRITGMTSDGNYRTRGDANARLDSTAVRPDEIVGVGRVLVPVLGLPIVWLDQSLPTFAVWLTLSLIACGVALGTMDDDPLDQVVPVPSDESDALQLLPGTTQTGVGDPILSMAPNAP